MVPSGLLHGGGRRQPRKFSEPGLRGLSGESEEDGGAPCPGDPSILLCSLLKPGLVQLSGSRMSCSPSSEQPWALSPSAVMLSQTSRRCQRPHVACPRAVRPSVSGTGFLPPWAAVSLSVRLPWGALEQLSVLLKGCFMLVLHLFLGLLPQLMDIP